MQTMPHPLPKGNEIANPESDEMGGP